MRARLALLAAAEAARWPRLQVGRLLSGPGETRWRQGVTLAKPEEVQAIAAALARSSPMGGASSLVLAGGLEEGCRGGVRRTPPQAGPAETMTNRAAGRP